LKQIHLSPDSVPPVQERLVGPLYDEGLPMKRFPLFPLLTQVALVCVVVYACSDSTAPGSRAALTPKNPDLALQGEHPPPPVETAISVCLDTCFSYDGTYFSDGSSVASSVAAAAIGDAEIVGGMSWLMFDQTKATDFAKVSANARFKKQEAKLTGMGKFTIGVVDYTITTVDQFTSYADCGHAGQLCASIIFNFTRSTGGTGTGHANAFGCEVVLEEGGEVLECGSIG
jgi:hypothetical protein